MQKQEKMSKSKSCNMVFFFGVKKEPRSLDCSAPPARLRMTGVTQAPNPGALGEAAVIKRGFVKFGDKSFSFYDLVRVF